MPRFSLCPLGTAAVAAAVLVASGCGSGSGTLPAPETGSSRTITQSFYVTGSPSTAYFLSPIEPGTEIQVRYKGDLLELGRDYRWDWRNNAVFLLNPPPKDTSQSLTVRYTVTAATWRELSS